MVRFERIKWKIGLNVKVHLIMLRHSDVELIKMRIRFGQTQIALTGETLLGNIKKLAKNDSFAENG